MLFRYLSLFLVPAFLALGGVGLGRWMAQAGHAAAGERLLAFSVLALLGIAFALLIFFGVLALRVMFSLGYALLSRRGTFTENADAARIIESFADDTLEDPWSWDDFETCPQRNPEVALALQMCFYAAERFPSRHAREYMAPEGRPYFKKIAGLLRAGALAPFAEKRGQNRELPEDLRRLLEP